MMSILYIITKGSLSDTEKQKFETDEQNTFFKISVFEFDESINEKGEVVIPITESKINPLLRYIFQNRFQKISIRLKNAGMNRQHARDLFNIIKASPYKGEIEISY